LAGVSVVGRSTARVRSDTVRLRSRRARSRATAAFGGAAARCRFAPWADHPLPTRLDTRSPKPVRRRSEWESIDMGIGAGILLIVAGAILTFALNITIKGIDLRVVGWILMLAGVAGLALFFTFWSRRRSARAVAAERDTYEVGEPRV